jgi:hypothetical protein
MLSKATLLHHLFIQLQDEYLENAQASATAEAKLRFSLDSTEFIDWAFCSLLVEGELLEYS